MSASVNALAPGKVVELPLSLIQPDPDQPRREFDKDGLAELAASIKERGVLQPITVRKNGKGVIIKMGERRFRAAGIAKLKTIPCILDDQDQDAVTRGLDQVAENEFRKDLNPIELSEFLVRLRDGQGKSVNEITDMMAKAGMEASRPAISNLMRLAELPDWSKKMVREGALTASHGKYLLQAPKNQEIQDEIKEEIERHVRFEGKVTVEDVEQFVESAVSDKAVQLNDFEQWETNRRPLFDIAICQGCTALHTIGKTRYCLTPAEFQKKQEEAQAKIKANPKAAPAGAARNAVMDQMRHDGERAKQREKGLKEGLKRRVREYFHEKLRALLVADVLPILIDSPLLLGLSAFMAVDMPGHADYQGYYVSSFTSNSQSHQILEAARKAMKRSRVGAFLALPIEKADLLSMAQACVQKMTFAMLRELAHFLQLQADPTFRIDEAYLKLFHRPRLVELAKEAGVGTVADLNNKQLRTELLKEVWVKALAVPDELQKLFDEKAKGEGNVIYTPPEERQDEQDEDEVDDAPPTGGENIVICPECGNDAQDRFHSASLDDQPALSCDDCEHVFLADPDAAIKQSSGEAPDPISSVPPPEAFELAPTDPPAAPKQRKKIAKKKKTAAKKKGAKK